MGCNACVVACKIENNTPHGIFWMDLFRLEEGTYPDAEVNFYPRPCMHCENAPCVKVCPVGSRFRQEDGFVLTDYETCIGCRYCEVACPYGVNSFNWKLPQDNYYYDWPSEGKDLYGSGSIGEEVEGAVPPYKNPDFAERHGQGEQLVAGGGQRIGLIEKCTWCIHRVEKGLKPACVTNCPAYALLFGDLEDPRSDVSRAIATKRSFRLLEELGTSPRVIYVGGTPPSASARSVKVKPKIMV